MNAPDGGSDAQGQALVSCQAKKIKQLTNLVETIKSELELCEDYKEESAELILQSVKSLAWKVRGDYNRFFEEIAKAGYATADNYADYLKSVAKSVIKRL